MDASCGDKHGCWQVVEAIYEKLRMWRIEGEVEEGRLEGGYGQMMKAAE